MNHDCGGKIFLYRDISGLWMKCDKCCVAELACPDKVFRSNIEHYEKKHPQSNENKETNGRK